MNLVSSFRSRFFPVNLRSIGVFGFTWFCTGYAFGVATLMGPVRWTATLMRNAGLGETAEGLAVKAVMLLYVAGTAVLSLYLTRMMLRTKRLVVRLIIPGTCLVMAGGAMIIMLTPELLDPGRGKVQEMQSARFTFGPYPTEAEIRSLKREGYTALVPLLHPAVLPFEPKLLADEKKTAASFGMELIHAPMLPWVSENLASLEIIKTLAQSGKGRYYIHCYLGKDRVRTVRRLIEIHAPRSVTTQAEKGLQLPMITGFERGAVIHLEKDVQLMPYPTDEEWGSFILNGYATHVLTLLDSADMNDNLWLEREKKLLTTYRMNLTISPCPPEKQDTAAVLAAVKQARTLPRPLAVHAYRTDSFRAEMFVRAWLGDAGPDSKTQMGRVNSFERGKVIWLGAGIRLTPFPTAEEMARFFLTPATGSVLILLDSTDSGERRLVRRELPLLKRHGIPFKIAAVPPEGFSSKALLSTASIAKDMERPCFVQAIRTDTRRAEAFLAAFRSKKPPLDWEVLKESRGRRPVRKISTNIAAGPVPESGADFTFLKNMGVRKIALIGYNAATAFPGLEGEAMRIGLSLYPVSPDSLPAFESRLGKNPGPWYLTGRVPDYWLAMLALRLGPVKPERVLRY